MSDQPLVTCIMPTKNRPAWVAQSVKYFARQTYSNRQLLIYDDSFMAMPPAGLPDDVFYEHCRSRWPLGSKRNAMVDAAKGEIICHWDDDDWYREDRIERQVALIQTGAEILGIPWPTFLDLDTGWQYRYIQQWSSFDTAPYLYCATLAYTKRYWASGPFPDLQVGAANAFVSPRRSRGKSRLDSDQDWYLGIAHRFNNSPKQFRRPEFAKVTGITPGDDWPFYEAMRETEKQPA